MDTLFKNYSLDTDSYEYDGYTINHNQTGGSNDKPTGGFPPIYICSEITEKKKDDKSKDDKTKREYKTHKSALSIKDILAKRFI